MKTTSQAARDEQKVARRAGRGASEETLREASLAHLDARRQRLEAYAESLERALETSPNDEQTARLHTQLAQANREAHEARRRRVPTARVTSTPPVVETAHDEPGP